MLPENIVLPDVIFDILKNNGVGESEKEAMNKSAQGKESRLIIVRDAARVIFQKKIPEEGIIELLSKHLETSREAAQKIMTEIKEKLIPYAKIVDDETGKVIGEEKNAEYNKDAFKETLLNKVRGSAPLEPEPKEEKPPMPNLKKTEIPDVDKNAQTMQKFQARPVEKPQEKAPEKPADPYKEVI